MTQTMAQNGPLKIGVLGGGPAGVMTALALEKYLPAGAATVTIYDRNASATDYPGVEYGIQARACRALERIGQLEQALIGGNPATEVAFYNSRLKKRFSSVKLDPKYTRSVVRQEFLADLTGLLQTTTVKRMHLVDQISCASDRRITLFGDCNGAAFSEDLDLLVAADGINSTARKTFFPEEAKIYDRGFSCIYMLVEGTHETAPAGFMEMANSGRSELIMGHFSTMTLFPLGKGRLALGIGFDHAVKEKLWRQHGLEKNADWKTLAPTTKKAIAVQLTADAQIYDNMLVKALDLVTDWDTYKIYLWAIRDSDPMKTPWVKNGNLVLLGDAAHAIMPTIGMGASLAIEDAEILAALIAKYVKTGPTIEEFRVGVTTAVFQPFTTARHPVWEDLIYRARRAAVGNFIDVNKRKRFAIGPQIPNKAMSRLAMGWGRLLETLDL